MRFGLSELVKKTIEREIIEKEQESATCGVFTLSVVKNDGAIPTGILTKDGRMVYIQP